MENMTEMELMVSKKMTDLQPYEGNLRTLPWQWFPNYLAEHNDLDGIAVYNHTFHGQ